MGTAAMEKSKHIMKRIERFLGKGISARAQPSPSPRSGGDRYELEWAASKASYRVMCSAAKPDDSKLDVKINRLCGKYTFSTKFLKKDGKVVYIFKHKTYDHI